MSNKTAFRKQAGVDLGKGDPAWWWWRRRRQEAEAAAAAATRARSAWERLREDRLRARRIVIGLADRELQRPVAGLEEVNEPGRCFLGSVLGNPVAGWARGSPREYGPAPPPLNAGGVRGSGRGGGGGGRSGRSGESMPPALRFAQAALAARAPVAQDETRLHAARLGSQPDAVAPAASALAPAGHARPLQALGLILRKIWKYLKETLWYSEDDYIQIITNIKNCPWRRHAEEYENFRAKLASCCDAVQTFVVSQNNTPMGTNMSYEVESKRQIPIRENIFQMFPVSQPFVNYPYNQCAVVGNGGILNKSLCGAEIDKADFVFRCNLPPVTGNASKDVGNKTNLVTVNPSIITLRYKSLKGKNTKFLEDISNYGETFLLLPAFSYRFNTGISFKVYQTLHDSKVKQKVLFFHPTYLRLLALFWRTRGVTAYRLSTGLMIASVAVELCKNVTLYGFWPFSKSIEKAPISHHYYDNNLPKRGFHQMPKEFNQMLQLHMRGILKLQLGKCDVA
ncbi:Alpha-2,8-sialyltransferase 8F [Microtus ochrogaster]|uniref:Alpha-2,8-sialyltransferase 8F n=1 Tax=Microtus ochrogaster TaxID=79684 RepID=A0A8J6FWV4_MICOH|nr:Alpha-2,8-sialyltransferase 8F [Microtus ochrogaster]